uniref:MICOS complex subunit MIC19 n=1 Tax=Hucho hucho TaxID=62062 RepID=A0A4W5RB89_9TELE
MGANNSTRRVSFESDENDNITVVKGIRVSAERITTVKYSFSLQPAVKPIAPPPPPAGFIDPPPCEPIAPPPQPPVEAVAPPPAPEPVEVVGAPLPPPTPEPEPCLTLACLSVSLIVDEEELRKKITEDLKKGLLKERAKAEQELQAWLEEEKVHAASFAEAEAQASVKYEVGRILELERATTHNTLTQAVMREKVSAEEERLRTQLYVKAQSDSDLEFICLSLVLSSSHFLFISLSLPPSPSLQIQITCHCVKWTPLWCTLMCNGCSDAHAVCLCACVCARVFVTEYVLSL